MPFMEVGGVVDLATPEKGLVRWSPSLPRTPQGAASAVEADIQDSPRLPSDWSPLEYELLECPPRSNESVRRAAEQELYDLASRARVAEESNWKLRREQNNEDAGRKNLWEAEAKLNKLQTRVQQLEARRRNVQRKALQREEEVRQLSQTNAQMQAEICSFRGAVKDFDASVGREQQLRAQLRELRDLRKVESRQASPTRALVLGSPSPLRRAGEHRG
ncbi:unnamed protein product [Effrenium voratum]|nr:unnamed protein product [Effrenium voratum]